MARYCTLSVVDIIERHDDIIKVRLDDGSRAYAFPRLCADVRVDDKVIVNTTAVDLDLGTGGWHFIVWNLSLPELITDGMGHIMKMRYTPLQINVGVAEEFDDWDHERISLDGMAVIAAPLHSHIPAIVAYAKQQNPEMHITVAISDGASLPLAMSDTIRVLKEKKLIDGTITFGHAFGGEVESINIYTALLAAKNQYKTDLVVVSMGPGIVGTNSKFGFTGIEVAYHLDVASQLGANSIGVVRASSADPRERHRAVSHHAITTYAQSTFMKHKIGLINDHPLSDEMRLQLSSANIDEKHEVIEMASVGIVDILESMELNVTSMGRKAREDELFFEMAAVAARIAMKENQ